MSEGYCIHCRKFVGCSKKYHIHNNWDEPECYEKKSDEKSNPK